MKRLALISLVTVMVLCLSSISFAGDRARGRWEGFAIGLGAVTLYNLFEHGTFSPVIPPQRKHGTHVHHPPVVHEPSGHWEVHREWIPDREEQVWVNGHYENGSWVKGHYETRVYPGYTKEYKVWVEHQSYRRGSRIRRGPPPWAPAHGYRAKY